MIKFENLSVTYPGGVEALKDINLEINEGDFLIIVGLSGAGKSTLLRATNNLVKPTKGNVYVDSKNVTTASKKELKNIRSDIGMIFQTFNLVNRSTVLKNVLTGRLSQISTIRSIFGLWPKDQKKLAFEALNQVEILEKAYVRASNLSGGQQQRVGIARALSQKPKVMLADEPVASLDPITSRVVMSYLKKINTELGITTIVNLHFLDLAKEFGDRLIGLRDGELVYDGKVSDVSDKDFENIYGRMLDMYMQGIEANIRPEAVSETILQCLESSSKQLRWPVAWGAETMVNPPNGMSYISANTRIIPGSNKAFRQATACIIDKDFIIDSVLQGTVARMDGIIPAALGAWVAPTTGCLLYTSPRPRDRTRARMPSSA